MTMSAISVAATTTKARGGTPMNPDTEREDELAAEDLIEEVSIDGMCGVY